jgi:hypothetical protein
MLVTADGVFFLGALGTRKAYLCFLRFWQRAADR